MPINLDSCITGIFVPGNIGASFGMTPVVRTMPSSTATITSLATDDVDEDIALSHTLTANQFVTWSLAGGADQAQFELSGSTLRWVGNGTQDFEAPADADSDNVYEVIVRATNTSANATDQAISVTVNDVSIIARQAMAYTGFVNMTSIGQVMTAGGLMTDES